MASSVTFDEGISLWAVGFFWGIVVGGFWFVGVLPRGVFIAEGSFEAFPFSASLAAAAFVRCIALV